MREEGGKALGTIVLGEWIGEHWRQKGGGQKRVKNKSMCMGQPKETLYENATPPHNYYSV